MINDAFYCPDAFDLSFWGMKGDLDSKMLEVRFDHVSSASIEGKELLMLMNNKRIFYDDEDNLKRPLVKPHTSMHWLPLSAASPIQTTFTFARERVY